MKPVLKKIDHILVISPDAELLFTRFSSDFQLPVAWPFKSYGAFVSGGIYAGNTNIEFLAASPGFKVDAPQLGGLAFEPSVTVQSAVVELERAGIAHGPPQPFGAGDKAMWTNMSLPGLMKSEYGAFICEYHIDVFSRNAAAREQMAKSNGGPLTLVGVSSVTFSADLPAWEKIALAPNSGGKISVGDGPELKIKSSHKSENVEFRVKSLAAARDYLKVNGWLGEDFGDSLTILGPEGLSLFTCRAGSTGD